jgi:parvulin-like peptidyl-prolyl isomerase
MSQRSRNGRAVRRYSWRSVGLVAAGLAAVAGAAYWARCALVPQATAQPAPDASAAPAAAPGAVAEAPPAPTDYARRVVAYVWDTEPVTRQDLGEYLIARCGPEKLGTLVNVRLIQDVCRQEGLEVTAAEVESAVAEDLQGSPDQSKLLKQILARYRLNYYEWKEEVVKPRLLLNKLCRQRVQVNPDEIQHAYEAAYGPKVECRVILYPDNKEGEGVALAHYAQVRDSEEAFDREARSQYQSHYAAAGGKIQPFGRFQMEDPAVDRAVFPLRPGEVSEVVKTRQGPAIFKCVRQLPADPVALDSVRDKLVKTVFDAKMTLEMKKLMPQLRAQAQPRILLQRPTKPAGSPPVMPAESGPARPEQVVAWYNGKEAITREQLGEYLIACFGAERLEMLVNRIVVDRACTRKGITVTEQEVDGGLAEDLTTLNVDEKVFARQFLAEYRKTLYEYREDAVRSRLLLGKLAQGRVRVSDEDLKRAYEAFHGEKVECRMILWPASETQLALKVYPKLRDSEEAFAEAAKHQASPSLAAKGGRLEPFGRHTLGDDNLENEAFKLKPGDVSTLVGTPQGNALLKCDRRIPADTTVTLQQARPELEKEVRKRRLQMEMQVVFRDLAAEAHPKLLLRSADKPADLAAEVRKELAETKDAPKLDPAVRPAQGP